MSAKQGTPWFKQVQRPEPQPIVSKHPAFDFLKTCYDIVAAGAPDAVVDLPAVVATNDPLEIVYYAEAFLSAQPGPEASFVLTGPATGYRNDKRHGQGFDSPTPFDPEQTDACQVSIRFGRSWVTLELVGPDGWKVSDVLYSPRWNSAETSVFAGVLYGLEDRPPPNANDEKYPRSLFSISLWTHVRMIQVPT